MRWGWPWAERRLSASVNAALKGMCSILVPVKKRRVSGMLILAVAGLCFAAIALIRGEFGAAAACMFTAAVVANIYRRDREEVSQ